MSKQGTKIKLWIGLTVLCACLAGAPSALAAPGSPAWQLTDTSLPTNFVPGSIGGSYGPMYILNATNVGGAPTSGEITFTDTLPVGIRPIGANARSNRPDLQALSCSTLAQAVTCSGSPALAPARHIEISIRVEVDPLASGDLQSEAEISGGDALPVSKVTTTTISSGPPGFDFLPGFNAPATDAGGGVATQAGSHPYQLTFDMSLPTETPVSQVLGSAGHLRDLSVDLPRGEIVNPNATPVRCTEVRLISEDEEPCPDASQIGTATVLTTGVVPEVSTVPLFNMVAPPGAPSSFGFDALGVGVFIHILGSVRSSGDYGLTGGSTDLDALGVHPIFGIRVELWGDPSSHTRDEVRGTRCWFHDGTCQVDEGHTALLTLPTECSGAPTVTRARADSWEEPTAIKTASYESADLGGTPASIGGCNQLEFEPTIKATPTTNLADSPSGLDVILHQPTDESLAGLSPAIMRNTTVTLPAGMTVNPSSADGQGVCSEAEANVHTTTPSACPSDSRLASAEVTTPLLEQPLVGSVYLAKPFANPFGSLIAIYLAINDPKTGTVANLAGEVRADPVTGQLTTTFRENPQLPLEDVKLHFFVGPRASFRTPATCGAYSTTTNIEPWSAPETANAHPSDSFAITTAPGGGACPETAAQAPHSPSFSGGTIAPQAGAFSPFVLKVKREDATQPLAGIDMTLPPGLTGKLAGIVTCSEAQIAQAQARSHPNEGAKELASPSCPASSEVGQVDASAGAGITPLHVQGHAYLAGPYAGAPLSLAVITPAVAGPFDLGVVVVRVALHVDSTTTQIHAVSDPFPQILDGIPLDLRQITLQMGRPDFTLNPTSCDPMTITGSVSSALGKAAGVSAPFQVGGCSSLAFKPKLILNLRGGTKRGGHPALKAILTMPKGGANIASAVVALPHSEFIDQGHFRTICTRVQFAAHACPKGAIYGHVRATSPLVDYAVEGPVYLRSSNNQLPDLVLSLHGPPSQPIEVEAAGRVDSVHGGIRTSFEAVPDLPISKVVLEMEGGKKGLFENSTDICAKTYKAQASFEGQNGKASDFSPPMEPRCKKSQKRHRKHHHR